MMNVRHNESAPRPYGMVSHVTHITVTYVIDGLMAYGQTAHGADHCVCSTACLANWGMNLGATLTNPKHKDVTQLIGYYLV